MTKKEAVTKWWYRLLKVIYIIAIISSLSITVGIFISNIPELNKYSSRFSIECNDGRVFGDFDGSDLSYDLKSFDNSYYNKDKFNSIDGLSKSRCYHSETKEEFNNLVDLKINYIPHDNNYSIIIKNPVYYGSWYEAIGYSLVSIIVTIVFFSFIRAIFLYIAFSESFWINLISILNWFKKFK